MSLLVVNKNGLKVETDAEVLICQDLELEDERTYKSCFSYMFVEYVSVAQSIPGSQEKWYQSQL